jgi:hypothetical protein
MRETTLNRVQGATNFMKDVSMLILALEKLGVHIIFARIVVAHAFAAWEMKVPLAETNVQLEIEKNQSYQSLLTISTDGSAVILPDPCKDILPWKSEKEGMKDWPPVYFSDICIFILSRHAGKDVGMRERILNEYKEGKAFRYFDNNWLKEVFFVI